MFSPSRFARLARAHFAEHGRGYAWFLAGALLLEVVVSILFAVSDNGFRTFTTDTQEGLFYLGLFLFSTIFAGRYFLSMGRRAPALLALMRPASGFEKWLLGVLVVVLLFPLAYGLVFYLMNLPDTLLASAQAQQQAAKLASDYLLHPVGDKPAPFDPDNYRLFLPWREFKGWREFAGIALWLLALQGFAMFGSLYFRNVPFIKTLLAALVFLLLVALFSTAAGGNPDLVLGYWDAKRPLSPWQFWAYGALWFAVPAMLWLACYLALREREITA